MFANTGIGEGIMGIAAMLGSIALIALIIGHSKESADLIQTAGSTFEGLLRTVTLQNQYGNVYN